MKVTIEILNPAHPAVDKLSLLVRQYLKLCCNDRELTDLKVEFNGFLDDIDELIKKKSGGGLDMYINLTAAYLSSKFKMPVTEVIAGLRMARAWTKKELSK